MLTYKDFDSRTAFVEYLGLYHNNKKSKEKDFHIVDQIPLSAYHKELDKILLDIDIIRQNWNNQSIIDIEKSVAKQGEKQLDIMQGQKNDKLRAGYDPTRPMYRVKNCENDSFFYEYAKEIGLDRALARYHIQFPGEVTAWHTDIYSPVHEFLLPVIQDSDSDIGKDKNVRRILIALQDWDWGQILLFGKTPWLNWNAGQTIYWNYGVPHSAANTSYTPRISVSITGLITKRFNDKVSSGQL